MNPSTVRAQHFPHYHKRWKRKRRQSIRAYIKDWYWLILIVGLAILFYLVNFHWARFPSTESNIHLAQPLMWSSLALMAYLGWRFGLQERQPPNKRLVTIAVLAGVSQVALYALAGLLYGFNQSPNESLPHVLGNMLYVVSMLVGVEISRALLLATFRKGNMIVALLVSSYIFWFLSIPITKYASITDLPSLLRVTGETFLPVGAESLLASFLALIGGPTASIAYRGVLHIFKSLSPILPDIHWALTAVLGTMASILGMLVIRSQLLRVDVKDFRSEVFRTSTLWVLAGAILVTLFWFNTGVFGVQPTVVSGVSMEPAVMSGDVVITREVPAESVEVGDIIRFRRGDTYILHRVVEVQMDGGEFQFITRGDANYSLDPPVSVYQLHGKVILTVPKIGWMTIAARQLIDPTP
ncbi:MAG TPA: signal peptidase I [Anaerolineae bacterium]|nr:signal peptidase I [Anaerolineae bacterium]